MIVLMAALKHVGEDPKAGMAVAATTVGAGAFDLLNWIPDDIGKLGVLLGLVLTVVVVRLQLKRSQLTDLEIELARKKLKSD